MSSGVDSLPIVEVSPSNNDDDDLALRYSKMYFRKPLFNQPRGHVLTKLRNSTNMNRIINNADKSIGNFMEKPHSRSLS